MTQTRRPRANGSAEARKNQTRDALRKALLALLKKQPFDQITITEIVRRAKVGYATFFRHYQRKEDVLEEIAAEQIRALLEMTLPLFSEISAESSRLLCSYVLERRALWTVLLTGGAAASVRAEFVRQAREWAASLAPANSNIPIDLGTTCSSAATLDALGWWLDRTEEVSVDEIANYIHTVLVMPFVQGTGAARLPVEAWPRSLPAKR